jgi:hypothetical protein
VVERVEEPVAAPIAREHPTRPVPAVCRRRQPHQKELRIRVAEARQRSRPVVLAVVAGWRLDRDRLSMGYQTGATAAVDDRPVQLRKRLLFWQSARIVTRSCPDGLWNVLVRGIVRRRAA